MVRSGRGPFKPSWPRRARAMHEFFFENLRNLARSRRAGLMRQFRPGQVYSTRKKTQRSNSKSASMVLGGIAIELVMELDLVPWSPIFEKCPHLREKGGVLTLRTPHCVCADPYSNSKGVKVKLGSRHAGEAIRRLQLSVLTLTRREKTRQPFPRL